MSRVARAAMLSLWLGLVPPAAEARVVLVGIDGASWRVIDGMRAEGHLPAFDALLRRGVSAELETVEPVVSPVVWTSVATGRSPEAHGIGGFLATRLDVKTPTVFERLAAAGVRVGLFEYLVSWPPPSLPGGFAAPGWMRRDPSVFPPDLFEQAGVAPWRFDYPEPAFSREEAVAQIRDELARKPGLFLRLVERFEPEVAATILYGVDRASHRFWREAYPEDFGDGPRRAAPREGSLLFEAMRQVDAGLGQIAAALGPEDVLMIASDHGFQADPERDEGIWVGRAKEYLASAGLDESRDGFTVIREWGISVVRIHPGPFAARDAVQARVVAFYESITDAEGAPLMRVMQLDEAPRPAEAARSWFERAKQYGLRFVARRFFGAEFDEPAHGWVIARFHDGRMTELGPDATLRVAGKPVRAGDLAFVERFDGTHHPIAVFVAAGGPLKAVAERGRISVLDIASLIAYLAGQPVPDDLEGRFPKAWLAPAYLAANPVRVVPAEDLPSLAETAAEGRSVDDDAMTERLRALGYVR